MTTSVNLPGTWPGSGEGGGTACSPFGQFLFPEAVGVTDNKTDRIKYPARKSSLEFPRGEKQTLELKVTRSLRHESAVTVTASFRGDKDGAFAGCLK